VWDFLGSGNNADLVQCSDFGTQTAVYAKYLAVDNSGEGKEVEDLTAGLPHRSIAILGLAFLVETVDLGDLSRFVVSADECDAVRKSYMVSMADTW
jgi:hypothetical protein